MVCGRRELTPRKQRRGPAVRRGCRVCVSGVVGQIARVLIMVRPTIFRLLVVLPLVVVALQQLGLINRGAEVWAKRRLQAICIALFLVLGHVAMIAGMADPGLLGWQPAAGSSHESGVHGATAPAAGQAAASAAHAMH